MELTDIAATEKWMELEQKINRRSGMNAAVFNREGVRITNFVKWANSLCPVVKADEKGKNYICALAHQNIAAQAEQTHRPVIEECDAGLMKLAVPIFINGQFLGVAGGCGYIMDSGEVDLFMIHKATGIAEDKLAQLSEGIPVMTREQALSHVTFIENEIEEMINGQAEMESERLQSAKC
jgi:ligand-binding sensor protein